MELGFQFGRALRTFEEARGNCAKDEAAKMGHIRDAAGLYICHGPDLAEKLNEKPKSDQECRGNYSDAGEEAKQKQRPYSIARVGDQKSAHNTRNRAARAQIGN